MILIFNNLFLCVTIIIYGYYYFNNFIFMCVGALAVCVYVAPAEGRRRHQRPGAGVIEDRELARDF